MTTPSIQTELRDFFQFASQRVTGGGTCSSLEELIQLWRCDSEYAANVVDMGTGIEHDAAGEAKPIDAAFAEVGSRLGISS